MHTSFRHYHAASPLAAVRLALLGHHPKQKVAVGRCSLRVWVACLALFAGLSGAIATPYASSVTNDSGTIRFVLNEAGTTVYAVFNDGSTNLMGVLSKGAASFALGGHTNYAIYCTKAGSGTPVKIRVDTDQFSQ